MLTSLCLEQVLDGRLFAHTYPSVFRYLYVPRVHPMVLLLHRTVTNFGAHGLAGFNTWLGRFQSATVPLYTPTREYVDCLDKKTN